MLSNFFVAAYALINLCVFHACFIKSPSWRPQFIYYNMWASLAGCLLCIIVMFLMDWKTALATYVIIALLCYAINRNKPDANWGSSTQSQSLLNALKGVHNLTKLETHIKNYRPKVKQPETFLGRGGSSSGSSSFYGSGGPRSESRWELGYFSLVSYSPRSLIFPIFKSVVRPKSGPSWMCNTTGFSNFQEKINS